MPLTLQEHKKMSKQDQGPCSSVLQTTEKIERSRNKWKKTKFNHFDSTFRSQNLNTSTITEKKISKSHTEQTALRKNKPYIKGNTKSKVLNKLS